MKKFKYVWLLFLLAMLPAVCAQAANDVTITADTDLTFTSPASRTLVLKSGSTYSTMTIDSSSVSFTVSPGGQITVTSAGRYILHTDQTVGMQKICGDSESSVEFTVGANEGDRTIVIRPGENVCDGGSSSSSGSSGQGGSGSSSSGSTTVAAPAGTQTVSKTVKGVDGGSVMTVDGRAGVNVPAGLAGGNVSMNIVPKASSAYISPLGSYSAVAGQVYDFSLSSGGSEVTQFTENVTLSFGYTNSDVAGLNEDSLQVYYWDATAGKWVLVGGTVDKVNKKISVEVNHFTIFGVFGTKTSNEMGGDLIKLACAANVGVNDPCRSVYYLGRDNRRYVFPNERTFKSWYADFSNVKIVASDVMASYLIGGNVTMRPGTYLVKITTDPKVYAVEAGGKLRWLDSESTAKKLYGNNWAGKVVDVSDSFFVNYNATDAVANALASQHPAGTLVRYAGSDDVYYVVGNGAKRLLTSNAMSANGLRNEFVVETDIAYSNDSSITSAESNLKTTAGP